jgi:hypothetical protein
VLGQPEVVHRGDQPYVAIKALVTMETLGAVLPGLHPEVRGWITARGDVPSGAPFFKYNVIDMERALEVEVGFPVTHAMTGDERVQAGVLPGGDYALRRAMAKDGQPGSRSTNLTRRRTWTDGTQSSLSGWPTGPGHRSVGFRHEGA